MKKTIAVGNSSFVTLIEDENYYVDKTAYIKAVMESGHAVDVITRPRRFGKTLFMDTLHAFLTVTFDRARQQAWFKGLKIAEDKVFCEKFLGQFPVIFLSLKGVEGQNFQWAYRSFTRKLVTEAKRHEYLLESPRLGDEEKAMLRSYSSQMFMRELSNLDLAESFLGNMIAMLAKHYEKQVVLLVDEYDVPLARAAERGYFSEMRDLLKAFLGPLKPETGPIVNGRPVLKKAVFTGCLRVSKESIFTGVNNFAANTVCTENDPALSAAMGFTPDEVNEMLRYYDLESVRDVVKHWYDGYRFGRQDIYSPWDLISFCSKASKTSDPAARVPENYWTATSGNVVIDEFLGFLSDADADRMQLLVDGGVIEVEINEQLTYAGMAFHKLEDFWTILLFTGYLTVAERLGPKRFLLKIPNEEIRQNGFLPGTRRRIAPLRATARDLCNPLFPAMWMEWQRFLHRFSERMFQCATLNPGLRQRTTITGSFLRFLLPQAIRFRISSRISKRATAMPTSSSIRGPVRKRRALSWKSSAPGAMKI